MAINPFGGCAVSAPTPVAAIPLTVSIPFWQASVSTAEVLLETARNNFVELSQQVAAKAVHGMAQKVATIKNKLASFTKARKAIDIAEDAASTFGKAGSHRAGPGKLKAIQDFFRNRRIACGGRGCNLPDTPAVTPRLGTAKWVRVVDELGDGFQDITKRNARRIREGKTPFNVDRQVHALERHSPNSFLKSDKGKKFPDEWSNEKMLNAIEQVADNPTKVTSNTLDRSGERRYGTVDGVIIRVPVNSAEGILTGFPVKKIP